MHGGKDGKTLGIREGVVKFQSGSMEIVLFSTVIDEVSNKTYYHFKKMRIQIFMDVRVLKSTETTTNFQKMKVSRYL